jgi:putative membrane protein
MRLLLRWISNGLAFYLALYLVDSLVAPRFFVGAVWVAILLGLFLGALNSLVRPLHRMRSKPGQAWGVAVTTMIINALVIQLFMWVGAPLSATGFQWVLATALLLTILAGVINWLIGFKPPKEPNVITRDLRVSREARGRDTAKAPRPRK